MNACSGCGAETVRISDRDVLCPACLIRLGLDTTEDDATRDIAADLRVLAPIGRGPDATVYLAQAPDGDGQLLTLKLFDPPVEPFRFVARVRALVTRMETCEAAPHLTILGAGVSETSHVFVVARFVPGPSIAAYARGAARRRTDALSLLARVCQVVSQLHAAGIVHGAIKPSNVIVALTPEGAVPMLLDTGVRVALDASRVELTSSSPRVHSRAPDRRSDIAGLRGLAANLFPRVRAAGGPDLMEALAKREFETASELAEEAAQLASRTSP